MILYLIDVVRAEHLPLQAGPGLLLHDAVQEVLWRHEQLPVEFHGGELDEAPLTGRQSDSLLVRIMFLGNGYWGLIRIEFVFGGKRSPLDLCPDQIDLNRMRSTAEKKTHPDQRVINQNSMDSGGGGEAKEEDQ